MNADLLNAIRREVAKNSPLLDMNDADYDNYVDDVINHLTNVELLNYIDIINSRTQA